MFHAIMCLRMRICVVHVDTRAMPVGAITISVASTSGNKDFWSEFLDLCKCLPVLWHVKSELYKNRKLKGGGGGVRNCSQKTKIKQSRCRQRNDN
jgi:hypothetical protein